MLLGAVLGAACSEAAFSRIDKGLLWAEFRDTQIVLGADQAGDRPMSAAISLPEEVQDTSVRTVSSPLWGSGQEMILSHGGHITTATLYQDNPYAHNETILGNASPPAG